MAASTGNQLAQGIRRQIEELKTVCEGLDESTASRAPAGRGSPKEILSHLWGPEGSGHLPILKAFLDRETPRVDIFGMLFIKRLSDEFDRKREQMRKTDFARLKDQPDLIKELLEASSAQEAMEVIRSNEGR